MAEIPSTQLTDTAQLKQLLATAARAELAEAAAFVDAFINILTEQLQAGEKVYVQGLGSFRVVATRGGQSRRVAFIADGKMSYSVNEPFNSFEPVVITERPADAVAVPSPVAEGAEETAPQMTETPEVEEPAPQMTETPDAEEPAPVAPETPKVEESVPEKPKEDTTKEAEEEKEEDEESAPKALEVAEATPEASEVKQVAPIQPPSRPKPDATAIAAAEDGSLRRKTLWIWIAAGVVALLLVGVLVWFFWGRSTDRADRPQKSRPHVQENLPETPSTPAADEIPLPDGVVPAAQPSTPASRPASKPASKPASAAKPDDAMLLKGPDGRPKTVRLQPGERLTLLALEHYGDKVFWCYIYKVNAYKLSNPNNVPTDVDLYLPDPAYWKIDAADATSRRRAAQLNAELLP